MLQKVNWEDLAQRKVPAPFKPHIRSDLDTSNFSEEFTNMVPACSPGIAPANAEKIFRGYSYVAPSVLFRENQITADILKTATDSQPSPSNVELAQFVKVCIFLCPYVCVCWLFCYFVYWPAIDLCCLYFYDAV